MSATKNSSLPKNTPKAKYNSKKVYTEFGTFDSKKEYQRWLELLDLQKRGCISGLKRQVSYELIPSQKLAGKVVERACSYKADFVYTYSDETIVEDVKGYRRGTAYSVFTIKRKLMLWVHNIRVVEV